MSFSLFRAPRVFPRSYLSNPRPAYVSSKSIDIISQDLCDQVLRRLKRSLVTNTPYDIVDFNPAGALFSSKIHEFLKPRTHILVGSKPRSYNKYLKHLVDQPGSTFKHCSGNPLTEDLWNKLFEEKGLLQRPDDTFSNVNRNLLILFNATPVHKEDEEQKRIFLSQYLSPSFEGKLMHRYGRTRLICLFHVDKTKGPLPRTLKNRGRLALLAEATSNVAQIAGGHPPHTPWELKGMRVIEESARQTSRRMKRYPVVTELRTAEPLKLAPRPAYYSPGSKKAQPEFVPRPRRPWHDEFEKLEARVKTGDLKEDREARKRASVLRAHLMQNNRHFGMVRDLDIKQAKLDRWHKELWRKKAGGNYSTDRLKKVVDNIQRMAKELDEELDTMPPPPRAIARHQAEHRRAFEGDGIRKGNPLLHWDRRPYEPLRVVEKDFSPKTECALLDFQPNMMSPVRQAYREARKRGKEKEYFETTDAFYKLCQMMDYLRSHSLSQILRSLFPGRPILDLVSEIPSLRSLAKVDASFVDQPDGHKSPVLEYTDDCLSEVAFRTVSIPVLWDIAVEWHKWPFKPVPTSDLGRLVGLTNLSDSDEGVDD